MTSVWGRFVALLDNLMKFLSRPVSLPRLFRVRHADTTAEDHERLSLERLDHIFSKLEAHTSNLLSEVLTPKQPDG